MTTPFEVSEGGELLIAGTLVSGIKVRQVGHEYTLSCAGQGTITVTRDELQRWAPLLMAWQEFRLEQAPTPARAGPN